MDLIGREELKEKLDRKDDFKLVLAAGEDGPVTLKQLEAIKGIGSATINRIEHIVDGILDGDDEEEEEMSDNPQTEDEMSDNNETEELEVAETERLLRQNRARVAMVLMARGGLWVPRSVVDTRGLRAIGKVVLNGIKAKGIAPTFDDRFLLNGLLWKGITGELDDNKRCGIILGIVDSMRVTTKATIVGFKAQFEVVLRFVESDVDERVMAFFKHTFAVRHQAREGVLLDGETWDKRLLVGFKVIAFTENTGRLLELIDAEDGTVPTARKTVRNTRK